MTKSIKLLLTILICAISFSSFPQSEYDQLKTIIDQNMDLLKVVGYQVSIIDEGELKWNYSAGYKNIETRNLVNDSSLFQIASCSKPVTALAIMKLYDQKQLDLDDDINKYLPFIVKNPYFPEDTITVRMLLTHTSSLRENWNLVGSLLSVNDVNYNPDSIQQFTKNYYVKKGNHYKKRKNFYKYPPGETRNYSNIAFSLLAVIVENITSNPFEVYMQKSIFEPLGMSNTYWFLKDIPNDNIVKRHNKKQKPLINLEYPFYPSSQLFTTTKDYFKILKLMINNGRLGDGEFLSKGTMQEFLKIDRKIRKSYLCQATCWFAEVDTTNKTVVYQHTGGLPGVSTSAYFSMDTKKGIILFLNRSNYSAKESQCLWQTKKAIYNWELLKSL